MRRSSSGSSRRRRLGGGTPGRDRSPGRWSECPGESAVRTRSSPSAARLIHPRRRPSVPVGNPGARGRADGPEPGPSPGHAVARRPWSQRRSRPPPITSGSGSARRARAAPGPAATGGANGANATGDGTGPRGPSGGDRAGDGGRVAAARRPLGPWRGRMRRRPRTSGRDRVETPGPTAWRPPRITSGTSSTTSTSKCRRERRSGRIAQVLGTGVVAYVGYVLLNSRGAYVLLSLLTARPLWAQVDPLAVLLDWEKDQKRKTRSPDDEETLQSLIEGSRGRERDEEGDSDDAPEPGAHELDRQPPVRRARGRAPARPRGRRTQRAKGPL